MATVSEPEISVVVPLYNEAAGLAGFHAALTNVLKQTDGGVGWEIIYCDDGSSDGTGAAVRYLHERDRRVRLLTLSRNFGKESALAAGIAAARGSAVIMLDGDGQHPVERIPDFIAAWRGGAQVVVGVRSRKGDGQFKRMTSWGFYKLFNAFAAQKLLPGSTDFRLIDRTVRCEFLRLQESERITRGLIDWLGFRRAVVTYEEKARTHGQPSYKFRGLVRLATNSFVSLSPTPLYLFGYLGIFITLGALGLGCAVLLEQIILHDPWHWRFTGTAMMSILVLFLVGIVLLSQGMLSLYVSHIHALSKRRPLYVVDYAASAGIDAEETV